MTKPNQEGIASENLRRQRFEHYCPRFLMKRPNKAPVVRPLFPRYVFVLIERVWYPLLGTRGISRVLMGQNSPEVIADSVVAEIKRREVKGLVQLAPVHKFIPGQKLHATTGPFVGGDLFYEGMSTRDRVKVLADMLGRKVLIDIEEKCLVAA